MSNEVINTYQQFLDATGGPLAAGTITFNINLTTTLDTIYSDEALTIAQSNPYTLDAAGRITGDVRYEGLKRLVIKDSSGATIRTIDNVATAFSSARVSTIITADGIIAPVSTPSELLTENTPSETPIGAVCHTSQPGKEGSWIVRAWPAETDNEGTRKVVPQAHQLTGLLGNPVLILLILRAEGLSQLV
jgi:hypothetical protein